MMRIITGKARGTGLVSLPGDATRPTSERTKEAVFSMLQPEIENVRVLDLFAGSGQMGLEALSRGAASAVLCDASKEAITVIKKNAEKTKLEPLCTVIRADYRDVLNRYCAGKRFDLVFLDPPYALGAIPEALRRLIDGNLLNRNAKIVCESASFEDVFRGLDHPEEDFEVLRSTHYGIAHITVLRAKEGSV